MNMDYDGILRVLITIDKAEAQSFNQSLEKTMLAVIQLLPEEINPILTNLKILPIDKDSIRWQYVKTVWHVLKLIKDPHLSENFVSVNRQKNVEKALEIGISIGVLPHLLPGIGPDKSFLCPQMDDEKVSDLQKYERLSSTVRDLMDLWIRQTSLRSALTPRLGTLLGALLQLSWAPLAKPSPAAESRRSSDSFEMTNDLYQKLTKDQQEFRLTLSRLTDDAPPSAIIKEFMIIVGLEKSPNWIRRRARAHIVDVIVRPNGIVALVEAVCNDKIDLGAHWQKLDTVARLVATSHGQNPEKYFNAVCSQLVNLLTSKKVRHATTIASHCITALYEQNPNVCLEKVVGVISAPLREVPSPPNAKNVLRTETEVADCIENLSKCFIPIDTKFKNLPCTLIKQVAIPLFCLHVKARQSVSHLRTTIKNLLINLLESAESSLRDNLFSAFLQMSRDSREFGEKLCCRFGPTGGLEIISDETENFDDEAAVDSLFDLATNNTDVAFGLFNFLLLSFLNVSNEKGHVIETTEDTFNRMGKQLAAMKLLSNLAGTRSIQEALIKNPEPLLTFVESLFNQRCSKSSQDNDNIIYIVLMLIKVILTESSKPKHWAPYDKLALFLSSISKDDTKISHQLFELVQEVISVIKNRGRNSAPRRYQDLNVDDNSSNESGFEKALRDVADPLLPVRAHGLMSLTKLIDARDPEAIAKKDIILCFFHENLKDEDSFVYLTAVNGLCALASVFPEEIIESLVQEYIDMPGRNTNGDITPETRAKLGETLVKTTRALGDMAPAYRNILINGFLCVARDPDEMVRASSLSCLGELCKVVGFNLGHAITEVIYCIGCIIETDKSAECRRAAVLVSTLLIRGLGKDVLEQLASHLVPLYRALKFIGANDDDEVVRLHAQLALEELDNIVRTELLATPSTTNRIFRLP